MLIRMKFEIDSLINEMLDKLPVEIWNDPNHTFLDPSAGGGQFLKEIEKRLVLRGYSADNIHSRVFGFFDSMLEMNYAKNKHSLHSQLFIADIDTIDNLVSKELNNMKFDIIIGNPPYQYPKGEAKSKKLYIDITKKSLSLLKDDGILGFIVPLSIIHDGQGNSVFNAIKNKLIYVDYDTNNYFNVGQTIISIIYKSNKTTNIIEVKDKNNVYTVLDINSVSRQEDRILRNIINKVDFKLNNRKKMKIAKADKRFGVYPEKLVKQQDKNNLYEVFCYNAKNRIQFTKEKKSQYTQLIIPYNGKWEEGCFINNGDTNCFWFVNNQKENISTLKNMKNFIESKLITYCVINYKSKIKPSTGYNFLFKLPQLDFMKSFNDNEIFEEFKLTQEEIDEINKWCKENKSLLPNKNNPLNEYL